MILQVGVKILIQNSDGKYLFLRRHPSFKAGAQKWDIPGGRIEPHETLVNALRREVREETGLDIESARRLLDAQDILVEDKDLHVVRLTYVGSAGGVVALSNEHDDYRWMTRDDALSEEHLDSYLREVLDKNEI